MEMTNKEKALLKELKEKWQELKEKWQELKDRPVGLLLLASLLCNVVLMLGYWL